MGRSSRNQMATAQAAEARRLLDLKAIPPPPGSAPLDLPTYDETQNSWVQAEFAAWSVSSDADKTSGAWRDHASLVGTPFARFAAAEFPGGRTTLDNALASASRRTAITFGDGGPSEAPAPELGSRYDAAMTQDTGRATTRPGETGWEFSGEGGKVERMPYDEAGLGNDPGEAPSSGIDLMTVALWAGGAIALYFVVTR